MMLLARDTRTPPAARCTDRDGFNMGMNIGQSAGAGIADHVHLHVLPRWSGDTNFMTTTGETRVLPEALDVTWERISAAFAAGAR